jgi:DNA repair protein RadC
VGKCITKYRLELIKESNNIYNLTESAISTPEGAVNCLNEVFSLNRQSEEVFALLVLNTKNKVVGAFEISRGSINSSIVHPREVFKRVLLINGTAIILSHNHPSGVTEPSTEDIETTKRLISAGELLGIKILDHLILGDGYTSMREQGLIQ